MVNQRAAGRGDGGEIGCRILPGDVAHLTRKEYQMAITCLPPFLERGPGAVEWRPGGFVSARAAVLDPEPRRTGQDQVAAESGELGAQRVRAIGSPVRSVQRHSGVCHQVIDGWCIRAEASGGYWV